MDPIFMHFVQELENEERKQALKLERRILRDGMNPFELPEAEFRSCYRLSRDLVRNLINELTPHVDIGDRNTRVPIEIRVFGALRFFAHGSYQRSHGNEANVAVAQQTFSTLLSEICRAIEAMAPRWITFPVTQPEKEEKKIEFMNQFEFPGVIGCIDGTHVAITQPAEDEHIYLNRKRYQSKNVQIICDASLTILNVNANVGGATHDAFIWRISSVKQHMEDNYQGGDRNSWLLGDAGYPQEPWLMTPIRNTQPDSPEGRYTATLTRARNCIERCIGVIKIRFRCILKDRVLKYHPFKVGQIINAVCVLHNMCIRANIPLDNDVYEENNDEEDLQAVDDFIIGNIFQLGAQRRAELINLYFLE